MNIHDILRDLRLSNTAERLMVRLVCVAGATTGATALLFEVARRGIVASVKGHGILPVEQDENALYLRVQDICNSLAGVTETAANLTHYVFSLSSRIEASHSEAIRAAISHSRLRSTSMTLTCMTRGEACWWASGTFSDAVVMKVGTVGFAHAFSKSFPNAAQNWRAGGWGLLSGDDGGAYYIGRQILYRLFEEQDGRKKPTTFSHSFAELMRESDTFAITTWIRQHKDTHSLRLEVSRLAQTAIFLAEQQSDQYCIRLLRRAAERLGTCFSAALNMARDDDSTFGTGGIDVFVQGRLIQFSPMYARFLHTALRRRCNTIGLRVRIAPLMQSPVLGCLIRALVERHEWAKPDAFTLARDLAMTYTGLAVEFVPQVLDIFTEPRP